MKIRLHVRQKELYITYYNDSVTLDTTSSHNGVHRFIQSWQTCFKWKFFLMIFQIVYLHFSNIRWIKTEFWYFLLGNRIFKLSLFSISLFYRTPRIITLNKTINNIIPAECYCRMRHESCYWQNCNTARLLVRYQWICWNTAVLLCVFVLYFPIQVGWCPIWWYWVVEILIPVK